MASTSSTSNASAVPRARQVIERHSRSFSLAVRLLPHRFRVPVTSLYAWCRTVDDAVDRAGSNARAEQTLRVLETDLMRLRSGSTPHHPASRWIKPLIVDQLIDVRHAVELIEGMRMDLRNEPVETRGDLRRYSYHAAGTVGLMMTRLMGVRDVRADRHAVALGVAMQMTNIARDVREDAALGRCYLPGLEDPFSAAPGEVAAAVGGVLESAERDYDIGLDGLRFLPRPCRPAIHLAASLYREIGREIARRDCNVLAGRIVVGKSRILAVTVMSLSRSFVHDPLMTNLPSTRTFLMNRPIDDAPSTSAQAKHVAFLGLSLTAFMAAALFVLVAVNPKQAAYSNLPLIYSGVSVCFALVFNRLAARCEKRSSTGGENAA
jgi:phytoene synthase